MAGRSSIVLLAAMAVAALFQSSAAQKTHVVGSDSDTYWTLTSKGEDAFTNWAAGQTFAVGDALEFNFMTGSHDVLEVTKEDFDDCNGKRPIAWKIRSPVHITLNSTGQHYFICSFHCSFGQKLAINVTASGSSPAPGHTATPSQAPPPAPASSLVSPLAAATPSSPATTTPSSSATPPATFPSKAATAASPSNSATPPAPTADSPSISAAPPAPITLSTSDSDTAASPATPPSGPKNSSPSLTRAAGFSATFLSIVAALLY